MVNPYDKLNKDNAKKESVIKSLIDTAEDLLKNKDEGADSDEEEEKKANDEK